MSATQPVIFLAFADDPADHLPNLEKEYEALYNEKLWHRRLNGDFDVIATQKTTPKMVADVFEARKGTVKVFHYSGHADSDVVRLSDQDMSAKGLKGFMEGVELVVLNGCATREQVKEYMQIDSVKAVIATRTAIRDLLAFHFADRLYEKLSRDKEPLYESFLAACQYIKGIDSGEIKVRSLYLGEDEPEDDDKVAWELWLKTPLAKSWVLNDIMNAAAMSTLPRDNKQKLQERFLGLESFRRQKEALVKLLFESPSGLHAFGCVIHGKGPNAAYGQHWISGNLFSYLLRKRIRTSNIQPPWNLSMEQIHKPIAFVRALYDRVSQEAYAFNTDNFPDTLRNVCYDLLRKLRHGPIVIRVKDDLPIHDLPDAFGKFFQAWSTICNVVEEQIPTLFPNFESSPPQIYPLIFLLVQEEGSFALTSPDSLTEKAEEAIGSRKLFCLEENADIDQVTFQTWVQEEIKLFTEPMLQQIIEKKKLAGQFDWFTDDRQIRPPIHLMNCICKAFDFQLEFLDGEWVLNKLPEKEPSNRPRRRRTSNASIANVFLQ